MLSGGPRQSQPAGPLRIAGKWQSRVVSLWYANAGCDVVSGRPLVLHGAATMPANGKLVSAGSWTTSDFAEVGTITARQDNSRITLLTIATVGSGVGNRNNLVQLGAEQVGILLATGYSTATKAFMYDSTNFVSENGTNVFVSGERGCWVATYNSNLSVGTATIYKNGAQSFQQTAVGGPAIVYGTNYITGVKGSLQLAWDGSKELVVMLETDLQAGEVASLSANPWQLLQPQPRYWFFGPAAGANQSMTAVLGIETLTGLVPVFNQTQSIVAPLGTETLTGLIPTITQGHTLAAPLGTETLTGLVPTFVQPVVMTAVLGTLTLTGLVPTFVQPVNVTAPLGTVTLTGLLPQIGSSQQIAAPLGVETLTGLVPTFVQSSGNTMTAVLGTMTLTGLVPLLGSSQTMQAVIGTVTLTGLVPQIGSSQTLTAPLGTETLTGLVPTFAQGQSMVAPLGVMTLQQLIPNFDQTQGIVVPLSTLTLLGLVPTFDQSGTIIPSGSSGGYAQGGGKRGLKELVDKIVPEIEDLPSRISAKEARRRAKQQISFAKTRALAEIPTLPKIEVPAEILAAPKFDFDAAAAAQALEQAIEDEDEEIILQFIQGAL